MEAYEKTIAVYNRGESNARLDYDVESVEILGELYKVGESYTSQELKEKLLKDYPFKIMVEKSGDELISGQEDGFFRIRVIWQYDSGNDAWDTYWGNRAYDYYEVNPNGKSISIKLRLKATQV